MSLPKNIEKKLEDLLASERCAKPGPYLAARIIATIDGREEKIVHGFTRGWKVIMISVSAAAAVLTGVATGNLYQPNIENRAQKVVLINDDQLENFGYYPQLDKN
jgi:hypothetical protein